MASATTAPAGGRLKVGVRLARRGVQPLVGERTAIPKNLFGREEKGLGRLDHAIERGRQAGGRRLRRKHPIAFGHGRLEGFREHEG